MLAVTILIYLTGVAVTAVGAFMAGRILRDPRGRTDHPLPVIVMAGIAWPLLVVGIAQLGGLSLLMKSR